jgi:hypothetical protein
LKIHLNIILPSTPGSAKWCIKMITTNNNSVSSLTDSSLHVRSPSFAFPARTVYTELHLFLSSSCCFL